jgi:hypothetical protein
MTLIVPVLGGQSTIMRKRQREQEGDRELVPSGQQCCGLSAKIQQDMMAYELGQAVMDDDDPVDMTIGGGPQSWNDLQNERACAGFMLWMAAQRDAAGVLLQDRPLEWPGNVERHDAGMHHTTGSQDGEGPEADVISMEWIEEYMDEKMARHNGAPAAEQEVAGGEQLGEMTCGGWGIAPASGEEAPFVVQGEHDAAGNSRRNIALRRQKADRQRKKRQRELMEKRGTLKA